MKKLLAILLTLCLLTGLCSLAGAEETAALPEVGEVISGFVVKEITQVNYLGAQLVLMEHEKSGAQLVYLANEDTNRSFSVGFRTVGENNKGLPHVFEHSALSGSEKYPSGNLFFQMIAQTYNTFLNASTSQYNTVYPNASMSEEQLLKFADFYMSGVLHPLLLEDERAMKREAYRYELTDAEADITVTGTVYSEMQGIQANLQNVAYGNARSLLFPGSIMSNDTGGVPEDILTMTHQDLKDFHEKYYHPSNMLLTLYGKLDYKPFLQLLDEEYLSAYDRKEIVITDDGYVPFEGYQEATYAFPATADADTGGIVFYNFALNGATTEDSFLGYIVANSFLMDNSPIKKLLRERLPKATLGVYYDIYAPVPFFGIFASNVTEADKDVFKNLVDEAIAQIAQEGIDQGVIDFFTNRYTVSLLLTAEESDVGVTFAEDLTQAWGVTGNPLEYLKEVAFIENFAEHTKDGAVNAFVDTYLAHPTQVAVALTVPVPGLAEEQNAAMQAHLADMKAAMSEEEIAQLVQDTADFAAWQEANEQISLIDQIKVVDVANLPEEAAEAVVEETTVEGVRVLNAQVDVEGVITSRIFFNADMIPFSYLHDYAFFTDLLKEMPTEQYSLEALDAKIRATAYGLSFGAGEWLFKEGGFAPYFALSMTTLDSKLSETYDLAEEILFHTDLSDLDKIRSVASDLINSAKTNLARNPHSAAWDLGAAAMDEDQLYIYHLFSYPYTDYLEGIVQMSDEELTEVVQRVYAVRDMLMNRQNIVLTSTATEEGITANTARAMEMVKSLDTTVQEQVDYTTDLPKLPRSVALVIDGTVQYNGLMLPLEETGVELNGKLDAMTMLTYDKVYVPVLRFQNGSYSVMCDISEDSFYSITYRDPELTKTYEVYASVGDTLRALDLTQEELDGYVTSAYSSLATPVGPIANARRAINAIMEHTYEPGQKQRMMQELKQFTLEDVITYADLYDQLYEKGVRVTVGSAAAIEANKDLFDLIIYP